MKKPARRVTPNNDTTQVIIKNPFLIAKLQKATRDMGWPLNKVIVFFLREGFDKPTCANKQQEGHPPEETGTGVGVTGVRRGFQNDLENTHDGKSKGIRVRAFDGCQVG